MNGLSEGIGAAIEGGLFGRAVEPARGETSGPPPAPGECANCGAMVTAHYCGQCGQKAHVHRSLAAIGHDIMHGVLHLDGKLWHTLPLLAFKPGRLTRRYIEGERAKFVSPMAMFLFSVFAMFAVFQAVGISAPTDIRADKLLPPNMAEARSALERKVGRLEAELEQARKAGMRIEATRKELDEAQTELKAFNEARTLVLDPTSGHSLTFTSTDIPILNNLVTKWRTNPGLMLYKLQANGYKFSWLLIPLSIPFVWLLFAWRRKFKAYDHAVFVTYSLAFMSLLFITMSIISVTSLGADWAFILFGIAAPLHLYKQLRYAYSLTRFSAFWRFCVLFLCIMIVAVLFLQALLVLGAF